MADTPKSFHLSPEIHHYLVEHGTPPDTILQGLIQETMQLGGVSVMQVAPEQGAFLTLIAKLIGARQAVEIGTFTGYSALSIARGLLDDGKLLCCDVSDEWTAIGRKYWEKADVAQKIELRIAPALDTLRALPSEPWIDLSFIDADKTNYLGYYTELVSRTKPGGLILVDNVLWFGRVVDATANDPDTIAIREFNSAIAADARVEAVMLPIADGLTLIRKF